MSVKEPLKGGRGKPCCSNDGMSVCGYLLRSYNCVACIFSLSPSLSVFFVCLLHTRRIGFSFKRQIHKTNERFVNNKNALLFDESGIQRVCVCVVCFACETKVKKRAFYAVNWNIHADINKNGKSNSTSQQTKCCTIVACGT